MTRTYLLKYILFFIFVGSYCSNLASASDLVIPNDAANIRWYSFNSDWKFTKDDSIEASRADYNDDLWSTVSIPHDFSILGDHENNTVENIGPFNKTSEGGALTGYTIGGTGWYRKKFILNDAYKDKVIKIHFDGVYSESEVWINGHKLGFRPNGYVPFYYDLTPYLLFGERVNVIAVKAVNKGKNSRWYSGAGIYRYVHLSVTNRIYIDTWGLSIDTEHLCEASATLKLEKTIVNRCAEKKKLQVDIEIYDAAGKLVSRKNEDVTVDGDSKLTTLSGVSIEQPVAWSVTHPYLYNAKVIVSGNGNKYDTYEEVFGIRTIDVTADGGFKLNGESILLKGANIHHDNGLLGAKAFSDAEERKVKILKSNGFNAIRTSHNPPSSAFLDACDRLGMVVINEFFDMWEHPKNPDDYHLFFNQWSDRDLCNIVLRDRNHPSIIMWSIGNEIYERADSSGVVIAKRLIELIREFDSTRYVTAGVSSFWDHKGRAWEDTDLAFQNLDIAGYNYNHGRYLPDHDRHPDRIMMGTESYALEAYDNWMKVCKMPWVIGDFVWTGMDYIGEAGIGHCILDEKITGNLLSWPWYNAWCGDIDIIGIKKSQSYYRDVVWGRSQLEVAVRQPIPQESVLYCSRWGWPNELKSWTWPGYEEKTLTLAIYSPGPFVRVELNGEIIEEKEVETDSKWITLVEVPYEPGEVKVSSFDQERTIATQSLCTIGEPFTLQLITDRKILRAGTDDLAFVYIVIVDQAGNFVPDARIPIQVELKGNGVLEAIGNASPTDLLSFNNDQLYTFNGRALTIVRAGKKSGKINLQVESEIMEKVEIELYCH